MSTNEFWKVYKILGIKLGQGWPTQNGLWAAFGKISKNIDFLGQILTNTVKKHSKYRKITKFQFKIGPQKFLSGPHAARGPRVGHPCSRFLLILG
jgi:hypothetical protein